MEKITFQFSDLNFSGKNIGVLRFSQLDNKFLLYEFNSKDKEKILIGINALKKSDGFIYKLSKEENEAYLWLINDLEKRRKEIKNYVLSDYDVIIWPSMSIL